MPGPHKITVIITAIISFSDLLIQLMYPDIKAAWPDAFWDSSSVDDGTNDVQQRHEYDPAKSSIVERMRQAVGDDKMPSGNHST